jgi:hypothetical protein
MVGGSHTTNPMTMAATDAIAKEEFDGIVSDMLIAAQEARSSR